MNIPTPSPIRHPKIVVKTPKAPSQFTLLNPRRLPIVQLEPEQFFPVGEANCDFVFQAADVAEIYVELKGGNFQHALDQLANTIRLLNSTLKPKHCFVVIRRSPTMDAKTQKQLLIFSKRHQCTMHPPKTRQYEYSL